MANQKDLAVEAAKMAVKQAAQKALMSAAGAIAPYVGVGCLIVLGVVLFVLAVCVVFVAMLYVTCNDAPNTIKAVGWLASLLPSGISGVEEAKMLSQICDIFKQ